ncbi:MAG: branched-chain amino acid ABC transporter permease [Deltaproteobacteria bacterium]|nr:branched-chain amino acid ABC transporter permease [Deltaproteobacteria bacterium]
MKTLAQRVPELTPGLLPTLGRSIWPFLAGFGFAYLMQVGIAPAVGEFYGSLLVNIGIAIVLAVSLNIVNGFAGQFSIGHAGFMLVGGNAAAAIVYYGSIKLWGSPEIHGGFLGPGELLLVAGCVAGGLWAAFAGLIVGLPSLRLRGDYLAIVTLGFGEIMRVLVTQTGPQLRGKDAAEASWFTLMTKLNGNLGFSNPQGAYLDPQNPFWVWVFVSILLIVAYRLKSSTHGRALLAVRENEVAAEAMGVPTTRAKVSAFVLAAFFAGIGGALFAHELGSTLKPDPSTLGFQKSFDIVIMVVIGGMGSITGAVLAAVILTVMPELFREFDQYRMIVYALALIFMMILRPQGLMGLRELWDTSWWRRIFRRGGAS